MIKGRKCILFGMHAKKYVQVYMDKNGGHIMKEILFRQLYQNYTYFRNIHRGINGKI